MSGTQSLAPGTRVGPYEVLDLLGQGGMGQVYRARDARLSRDVALKVVRAELAKDAERLRRFEQEAKAAGALNHPNIVAVYDTGQADGAPYIVSELLEGETVRDRMARGAIGLRKTLDYAVQIARGLAAAHEKGIVHRDLKPENLYLTRDGLVKILDFGIAKLVRPAGERADSEVETLSATSPGTILGTAGYMSPEQVRGLAADHRSDLFSFGALLLEMVTGRRAFHGVTAADTLSAILREDPTEALGTGPSLPPVLLRVVRRCLEKAPDDRFQTARDLAFALEEAATEPGSATPQTVSSRGRRAARLGLGGIGLLAAAGAAVWVAGRSGDAATPPSFQRLTFRVGRIDSARFAPDAETIVYSAEWGTSPGELFSTRATGTGSRSLGLREAVILGISSREEMAVLLRPRLVGFGATFEGTLARTPLAGGTPREMLEGVLAADWSPDGKDLAVVHVVGDRYRLEFPIGRVLYEPDPPTWISTLRVSPRGDLVAFAEHPVAGDKRGGVSVVGAGTPRRTLATGFAAVDQPAWTLDGDEVWFGGSRGGTPRQVYAVDLSGRERLLMETPGSLLFQDVSRRGQGLMIAQTHWTEIHARARGASEEAELAAADLSFLSDLSDDGRLVLGTDIGQGGGPNFSFYVQRTDGSAPVWLGEGDGQALSPDGRLALAVLVQARPQQLVVAPTGAGEARVLEAGPVVRYSRAVWHPSGRRVVLAGFDAGEEERLYLQDVDGGPPRPASGEGVTLAKLGRPVSPDGRRVVAVGPDGVPALYPLDGGEPTPLPTLTEDDVPLCWTPDGRELLVARYDRMPPVVERVDVVTGRPRPWKGIWRSLPSSLWGQSRILVAPDGESYAYGYTRLISDLYITSRLR